MRFSMAAFDPTLAGQVSFVSCENGHPGGNSDAA